MLTYQTLKRMFDGYDAYLVGGAARAILEQFESTYSFDRLAICPRDWDVLVVGPPPVFDSPWRLNRFGGFKYTDMRLDVWEGDIGKYLREVPRGIDGIAIHLATDTMLFTREFFHHTGTITTRPTKTMPAKPKEGDS